MEAEILTKEEQRGIVETRGDEAAVYARERYGVNLARVGSDPQEALALARLYFAHAICDPKADMALRGAAAKELIASFHADDRKGKVDREKRLGSGAPVRKALFGGPEASKTEVG